MFQEAYAVAENFYNLIPEDQKLPAAAATWNISASRQDELEQGDNSSLNSRKKVSNFVFATFGKEIVGRLDELQFSQLKVLGIGKEGDNFVGREWNPQEKYSIEIQASRYPPGHERHNSRLVFVKDDDEKYKEFAVLEQRTGQLPIGTQAQAYIKPGETYTATTTINLPSQPPINITIREISKFSHAGKNFNNEQVALTIGNVPIPVDTAKIKLAGQTLGELDNDSIQELRKINYLANGNPLQLKLKSIGDSQHEGGFIIAESPHGNLLKINKINVYDFKGQVFTGEEYKSVSLEVPTSKNRDAVFLNGELLGVLHYKKDKEALQNLGVLKHGQQGSVNCTLQSNFSHTFINIEPSTVQYPQIWTKEAQVFQDNSQLNTVTKQEMMLENSGVLLEKIKERPTILFTSQEDKVLGLIGIAVDNHKTELVQNWFKSKNIEFNVLPPQDVPLETKKGLSVIYLVSSTIPSDDFDALKAKFGEPLSADGKNSAYNQYLNSLPNRPHIIGGKLDTVQELATTTIPVTVTPKETILISENQQPISAVAEVLPVNTFIVSKPEEKDVVISGKPVQMVFPLKMHGEPNALPVSTTIDAMRGYGRCHTTRTYEPYKAYGFKEGDIAIASGTSLTNAESGRSAIAMSSSQQVAFRVGKQYRITAEMIADPAYQQQWGAMEKHSSLELATFRNKPEVWGLNMKPLGDYVNGKIVPFPSPNLEKSLITPAIPPLSTATPPAIVITSPVNIGSRSSNPLGATLTNPTVEDVKTATTPQPRDSVQEIITSPKSSNPLANLQSLNAAVATHMQKDVAMAEVATQFIGMSSHGLKLPNSTPFSSSNIVQKEVVADKTIQDQKTTLEKLRTWYLTAQKLGKSAEYIQRIVEVGNEFKSGADLTEKAVVAMNNDFQELHSINRLTQITQRMGDVFGIPQDNGDVIVQGKEYLISINNSHKDLTIIKKDGTVLLDIKLGQINQSRISAEVIDVFEEINNNINQSLASVKNQYLQV